MSVVTIEVRDNHAGLSAAPQAVEASGLARVEVNSWEEHSSPATQGVQPTNGARKRRKWKLPGTRLWMREINKPMKVAAVLGSVRHKPRWAFSGN